MNYCSQCGAPMKPTAKFCSQCGAPAQTSSQPSGAAGSKTEPNRERPVPVRNERRTGVTILLAAILLTAAAGGAFLWNKLMQKNARKELYDSIELQYTEYAQDDPIVITWYESGKVNPLSYIVSSEYTVTASPDAIEASVLGDTTVTYTVKAETEETGIVEKTFVRTFSVRDTHAPLITLVKESVMVSEEDGYSITDNIDRIWDDHDGELEYRKEKTDAKGTAYYTLSTNGDPSLPGTHTITVYAVDASGNETTEIFVLRVREEEKTADTP
ncbi:MAG: zinc ribbon domain-containing protein [Solobacterium sp.]|nr:zinc ribbon domain-containing protein [Solobacterium sp.]